VAPGEQPSAGGRKSALREGDSNVRGAQGVPQLRGGLGKPARKAGDDRIEREGANAEMSGTNASGRHLAERSGSDGTGARGNQPRFMTIKRAGLAAATALVAINIWTGAPLLALWVGSRVVGKTVLSMRAVLVVVFVLAILVFGLTVSLTWLNNAYDELIGRPRVERRPPWMRSMRAETERNISSRVGITALERIVTMTVYVAIITLLLWFIFLAGPPFLHN